MTSNTFKQLAKVAIATVVLLLSALTMASEADSGFSVINMPEGVTTISPAIYDLHMWVFWVCVVIGVIVFGFMFYVMWAHRKSNGHEPAQFHENHIAEIAWTVVPVIILVVLAFPATKAIIASYDTSGAELSIKVTGSQWKWQYEYLGKGVEFLSQVSTPEDEIQNRKAKGQYYLQEVDEPLVLPVNTKIAFKITATDVIHSWWVPDFAVKKDAIPGFITDTWANIKETGIYRGNCTELCGKNHAFMPVVVKVVEKDEFEQWLAGKQEEAAQLEIAKKQNLTMEEMMTRGEAAYNRSCAACHGVDGKGIPGAFPAMINSPIVMGEIDAHLDVVVNGQTGTAMQAFGNQLNEIDIAAIITYERNAWGNNTGDLVQPLDVVKFKSSK